MRGPGHKEFGKMMTQMKIENREKYPIPNSKTKGKK
jgi:hypothetical protein